MTRCPVFSTGQWLQMLGLALLIGGMLALGAFTAPTLFHALPRPEAGAIMTQIFRQYDGVLLTGVGLIAGGELLKRWVSGPFELTPMTGVRYLLLTGLIGLVLYTTQGLSPHIAAFQAKGPAHWSLQERGEFDTLHHQAESLYKTELSLAVLVLILSCYI